MSKIEDGGPAFPQSDLSGYGIGPSYPTDGMSLRAWFAGQDLPEAMRIAMEFGRETSPMTLAGRLAVEAADAMLSALAAREPKP